MKFFIKNTDTGKEKTKIYTRPEIPQVGGHQRYLQNQNLKQGTKIKFTGDILPVGDEIYAKIEPFFATGSPQAAHYVPSLSNYWIKIKESEKLTESASCFQPVFFSKEADIHARHLFAWSYTLPPEYKPRNHLN